jgi:hypothetical protein
MWICQPAVRRRLAIRYIALPVRPESFILQMRKSAQAALDPERSSVEEELKALDWQLAEIARLLGDIERFKGDDGYSIKQARRHLDTALQRSHRAQQIARGIRVTKAT